MKKLLLLFAAVILSISLKAQCGITQAVDFTATDCHGEEINLFEILDRGQYVLIDFFFTSCGPCQVATPHVVESYYAFGCNQHDVFYMEISPTDNNAACQNWCNNFGVEYPTIGTDGGGASICNTYMIDAYPTLILITPDREIVITDLWPIADPQTIISAVEQYGPQQHECGTAAEDPSVEIAIGEVTATTVEASFTPNETCTSYWILMGTQAEMEMWMQMMQMTLEQLVQMWGIEYTEAATYTWTEQQPDTEYTIYALPLDAEGTAFELKTQTVTTETLGGTGTSVIDIQVTVVSETSVYTVATPNEEMAEYHYGLITKELYEAIGADSALAIIRGDDYPLYGPDEWEWIELVPNTYYYAIGTGMNANGEWGETTMVEFITSLTSVESIEEKDYKMYPNPAKDYIMVRGTEIETVVVYNALGQEVCNYTVNGQEMRISTSSFEAGVYYMSVNGGKAARFVVVH